MSFLYPRTADFHRPGAQTGVGAQPYGGQIVGTETVIVTGVRCSIQERREGTQGNLLPGDGSKPNYYVFIPESALANGTLRNRDILINDLGERFQVISNYWDSLGYRLSVVALEA